MGGRVGTDETLCCVRDVKLDPTPIPRSRQGRAVAGPWPGQGHGRGHGHGIAMAMAMSLGPTSLYADKPSPKNDPLFCASKKMRSIRTIRMVVVSR